MNGIVQMIHDKRREADRLESSSNWDYRSLIRSLRREAYCLKVCLRETLKPKFNGQRFKNFDNAWRQYVREFLEANPEYDPSSSEMTTRMVSGFGRWLYLEAGKTAGEIYNVNGGSNG